MTATLPAEVTAARELVDPALRKAIDELAPSMRTVARYHLGWADEHGQDTPGGGGKSLRPALTLLAAQATGGGPEPAVPAAIAVELVHNFSLLHDDVMDNDTERRHRPTAWTVFGVPAAILAGDALLTLAVETARRGTEVTLSGEVVGCLNDAVQRLIVGQSSDVEFERRSDVSVAECLTMAAGKTGALMRCAVEIGALAVGAPESVVRTFAEYGDHLGLAFQLVDDLLGIWGEPEVTGKPRLADLRARKKSVPVVAALNSGTESGARLAELYFAPDVTDDEARLVLMADLVERAGGLKWTELEADRHIEASLRCLDELDLPTPVGEALRAITLFVTRRDR
ncbi:MAG TPA: polyprenyl synthetase family protein [Pseudonocardiaceae bacterium]|jgi:geranylgeranyl diphosphate synthase type I|nr:polyprenyl synthetase family protein [Pseudonocardiaceae bacterium]